jgi:hypothetical protein
LDAAARPAGRPLALAALIAFHPWPYDDYLRELVPIAPWWITLHAAQFALFAVMGAAVWPLTSGLRGPDVLLSRAAAAIFVLFYDLGDAVAGVATGILALWLEVAPWRRLPEEGAREAPPAAASGPAW